MAVYARRDADAAAVAAAAVCGAAAPHPSAQALAAAATADGGRLRFAGARVLGDRVQMQLFRGADGEAYPINALRNAALRAASTSHVLVIDVDFFPSAELHDALVARRPSEIEARRSSAFKTSVLTMVSSSESARSLGESRSRSNFHVAARGIREEFW